MLRVLPLLVGPLVGVLLCASSCGGGGGSAPTPIRVAKATKLVFTLQPQKVRASRSFGVRVSVLDQSGKPYSDGSSRISIALASGKLLGTTTKDSNAGTVDFDDLRIDSSAKALRLVATSTDLESARSAIFDVARAPIHILLFLADGWGYKQLEAARRFRAKKGVYDSWKSLGMSTWDVESRRFQFGKGYDPKKAWESFAYINNGILATDSASSATAMVTGQKTRRGTISVNERHNARLETIREVAVRLGMASGLVTSVPISHATPGAFAAHNSSRGNTFAIADEILFGNPNTTGSEAKDSRWGGHWGSTMPAPHVVLGGGHPSFAPGYAHEDVLTKLRSESGTAGKFTFVEREQGKIGSPVLLGAAADPRVTRLCGLFGGDSGNLDFAKSDGSGRNKENPTLREMTRAALEVLGRHDSGFVLMVEGGAVDWAGHANVMDEMLGEHFDFDDAVAEAVEWIEDTSNESNWNNTLVIITGDHGCGHLTAAPGVMAEVPLGEVSPRTIALERPIDGIGARASWEDLDEDSIIDADETVYWAWNSSGHTNSLIPCYFRGLESAEFEKNIVGVDPLRGSYVDNVTVFRAMSKALAAR